MAEKQPQLNGAYYGPSIPPAEAPRKKHSNCAGRCCCCLFSFLWKFILAIVIIVVLAFFIFWLVVKPRAFRFQVSEAKLTQFDYTNNTIRYNLVLNFTARNPNKKLNIYYDKVEGHVFYDGVRFASTDVITWQNSFRQYTKSTDNMSGVFSGHRPVMLDHDKASDFDEDKRKGVFDIDVKLYFTIRYRLGDVIGDDTKVKAKCKLEVPFVSKGTTVTAFSPTTCDVKF